jgi:thiol:disulfide interchange protein
MKRISLVAVLVLVAVSWFIPAQLHAQAGKKGGYVPVEKFDPARDAARDIKDAQVEARRSARRILVDVGGAWCIWCRRLDSLFMRNKILAAELHAGFVVVKVNYSPENKNEAVLSTFPKISGYPHLFVLDEGGRLLHSQDSGELESGEGHDPAKVLAFIQAWRGPGKPTPSKERR